MSRLKKELEKKDAEADEAIDRLTSKHSQEIGELKYKAQEAETKHAEGVAERERLRSQLATQVAALDLKDQLSHLEAQLTNSTRRCRDLQEDNERLQDENQSVSLWQCLIKLEIASFTRVGNCLKLIYYLRSFELFFSV